MAMHPLTRAVPPRWSLARIAAVRPRGGGVVLTALAVGRLLRLIPALDPVLRDMESDGRDEEPASS